MIGSVLAVLIALFVIAPAVLMRKQSFALERLYSVTAVGLVSRLNAGQGPPALDRRGADVMDGARSSYMASCAQCHGSTGDGKGAFGQATFPVATDLTSDPSKQKTDAQIFWIVKNGLGFTGMPGYASQYQDADISALVAYVRTLQNGD